MLFIAIVVISAIFIFRIRKVCKNKRSEEIEIKEYQRALDTLPISKTSFKCPQCNGDVPVSAETRIVAFCPYCGAGIPDARKLAENATKNLENSRQFQIEMKKAQTRNMELENELARIKAKEKSDRYEMILTIAVVVGICSIIVIPLLLLHVF